MAGQAMYNKDNQKEDTVHIRFTHSKTVFRYPPESFIKKIKRLLGIRSKKSPFVKLDK
jgi:hypothetical protein